MEQSTEVVVDPTILLVLLAVFLVGAVGPFLFCIFAAIRDERRSIRDRAETWIEPQQTVGELPVAELPVAELPVARAAPTDAAMVVDGTGTLLVAAEGTDLVEIAVNDDLDENGQPLVALSTPQAA